MATLNRASPADLRKAKMLVDAMVNAGIDFVPIPVVSDDHKLKLMACVKTFLEKIEMEFLEKIEMEIDKNE